MSLFLTLNMSLHICQVETLVYYLLKKKLLFFNFKRRETLMFDFYNISVSLYLEDSVQQKLCNHFLLYMLYTPAQINGIRFCEQQVYKLKFGLAQVTPPCYSTLRNSELFFIFFLLVSNCIH